jgi:ribose transport system permease protein
MNADLTSAAQTGADAPPEADAGRGRKATPLRVMSALLRLGALAAFALVILYFAIVAPGFLSSFNLVNVVEQSAMLGILAFGMTVVVIGGGSNVVTGGIDLSLAANLGLSAAVFAVSSSAGHSDAVAVALTLLTGLAIGALNALAIVVLGILPLLATLAVMNVCAGIELVLTENTVVSAASPLLDAISTSTPLGLSAYVWALALAAFLFIIGVQYTPAGLRLHAAGAYPEAAHAAGIPVRRYVAASYLVSGLCGSLAAILFVARLSGSVPGAGELLLSIIVATLMGVVFSRRLVATIGGTLLSVLFIGSLKNGFQLLNVSSYWVNGVQGVLILLVVSMTSLTRREEA